MKKGLLFVSIAALLSVGLVACGNKGSDTPVVTYSVKITNKEELQKEWFAEGANRNVSVEIPGVRVADEWGERLFLSSSNTSVVQVQGLNAVKPVGAGTARLTVKFMDLYSDYVDVTVSAKRGLRVVTEPVAGKDYILSMNSTAGRRFVQNRIEGYYIGTTDVVDDAAVARVASSSKVSGEYKYKITLTGVEDTTTGAVSTRTIGGYDSTGHINIGFVETTDVYPYAEQAFKFNSDYTFSTMISGSEYWIGTYGSYNTLSYRGASQIEYKAQLLEFAEEVELKSISLNKTNLSLEVGKSETLKATFDPASFIGTVTWESSNSAVAVVDANGKVTASGPGSATITAKCAGKQATCALTVTGEAKNHGTKENPLTVKQAKELLDSYGADSMTTQKMWVKGIVYSSEAENTQYHNRVVWLQDASGNKAFELYRCELDASIKGIGSEVDALKGYEVVAEGYGVLFKGNTYELTNNGNENPVIRTATKPEVTLEAIKLSARKTDIKVNEELDVTVSPIPELATLPDDLIWTADNEFVELVDNGKVKGKAVGNGSVTVSSASTSLSDTLYITVSSGQVADPWENKTGETLTEIKDLPAESGTTEYAIIGKLGDITQTTYGNSTIYSKEGSESLVVYGMYDSTGKVRYDAMTVKPVKDDVVVLKGVIAKFNETSEIKNAKVLQINGEVLLPPEVTSIALNKTEAEVEINGSLTLQVSALPAGAALPEDLAWSSDNEAVATVDAGVVTGVSEGVANIKVRSESKDLEATCVVTVSSASYSLAATFNLGVDGKAEHSDGTASPTYEETDNDITLKITEGEKMYTGARDAKGNGAIKFGTSSVAGKCKVAVPADILKVEVFMARYKAKDASVTIKDADGNIIIDNVALEGKSDDGAYDKLSLIFSGEATSFTIEISEGYRAMMGMILFYN